MLHGSIAQTSIVQAQHLPHVTPNSETKAKDIRSKQLARRKNVRLIMAYVNSTRVAHSSVFERVSGLFAGFAAAVQRRRVYAQTLNELRALSDRELMDLGISRSMITEIARDAAYGK